MNTETPTKTPRPPDPALEDRLRAELSCAPVRAPDGFTRRVMGRIGATGSPARARQRTGWLWPALAGAAAALLLMLHLPTRPPDAAEPPDSLTVLFRLHAPDARQVELVGDFTDWKPGVIQLDGPDASGYWTARTTLPAGRYEYMYLVDQRTWMTDPRAHAHRPDGFGNLNAVMNL